MFRAQASYAVTLNPTASPSDVEARILALNLPGVTWSPRFERTTGPYNHSLLTLTAIIEPTGNPDLALMAIFTLGLSTAQATEAWEQFVDGTLTHLDARDDRPVHGVYIEEYRRL
ncbi:hypothetical protein ACFVUS_07095 [Nocardia sp. NPDC058058]|uniref:hypothetical protein n=1 Tax=Nocardia sp. NPDC058058 TaxID=3346317 RepID=UPI0036DE6821